MAAASEDYVAKARELAPLIRECADEAERERRLPDRVVEAMAKAGLYRLAAPRAVGGGETHPFEQIRTIEAVSEADGATGWTLMIGIENLGVVGAGFPRGVARRFFDDPGLVVSGALNPLGRAVPVEGGYSVSGQWPFASGCENSQYFWGQCIETRDGEPARDESGRVVLREAFVPRSEYEIIDTWHVSGLRGSGSHDVALRDVFVPAKRMTAVTREGLYESGPLFRLPLYSRLAYNKVGVATGIARAAIDHFTALASEKRPRGSVRPLRERAQAQIALAEAETLLRSSRAFVFEAVGEVWDTTAAGQRPTREQRALVQLACSNAATASVQAVERVHAQAGTSANFTTSPLERCFRDVQVVRQHIMVSSQWVEAAGRVLMGLESNSPIL